MDDDKTDANKQRGKDGPGAKATGVTQKELLADIKATLVAQSTFDQSNKSSNDLGIALQNIGQLQKDSLDNLQAMTKSMGIDVDRSEDEAEISSVTKANAKEEARESKTVFDEILEVLKNQPSEIAKAMGEKPSSGGSTGSTAGMLAGLGFAAKGIGAGVLGIGGGIAILLASFLAADKIATEFKIDGKGLKKVLINLGEGLEAMGTTGLAAMGAILAAGVFGGKRAGMGVGSIGLGLATFFLALGATEKGLSWMDSDYSGLTPAFRNFSEAVGALDQGALIALGSIMGSASILALFPGNKGLKAGIGIGAIGGGIAAFFLALGATDKGLTWMNADGSRLVTLVQNMTDAFGYLGANTTALATISGMLVVGGLFGAARGNMTTKGKAVLGMGLIGMGIGAFFTGLMAGDAATTWMNTDGSNLKAIMMNIAEGLSSFTGPQLASLLAVGGLFAVVSAIPGGLAVTGMATVGLGLAGAAIGAFISGMAIGGKAAELMNADGSSIKNILVNTSTGLKSFNDVNPDKVLSSAVAMLALAPAMVALLTGQAVSKGGEIIGNIVDWGTSWFSDKETPDQIQNMVNSIQKFEVLNDDKLTQGAINVERLSNAFSTWHNLDAKAVNENINLILNDLGSLENIAALQMGGAVIAPFHAEVILDTEAAHIKIEGLKSALFQLPQTAGREINATSLADQISDKLLASGLGSQISNQIVSDNRQQSVTNNSIAISQSQQSQTKDILSSG